MDFANFVECLSRAAFTGKHDTLVCRAPGWQGAPDGQQGALRIHLTRLSTEGLGPRHGEVRRAHQMLNAALTGLIILGTLPLFPAKTTHHVVVGRRGGGDGFVELVDGSDAARHDGVHDRPRVAARRRQSSRHHAHRVVHRSRCRKHSAHPALCYEETRVPPTIRVLPAGTHTPAV